MRVALLLHLHRGLVQPPQPLHLHPLMLPPPVSASRSYLVRTTARSRTTKVMSRTNRTTTMPLRVIVIVTLLSRTMMTMPLRMTVMLLLRMTTMVRTKAARTIRSRLARTRTKMRVRKARVATRTKRA